MATLALKLVNSDEDLSNDGEADDNFDTEELPDDLMETSKGTTAEPLGQAESSAPLADKSTAPPVPTNVALASPGPTNVVLASVAALEAAALVAPSSSEILSAVV